MPRFLIIDDDDQYRKLLREMLTREGYEVADASNGKEGLRLYQSEPVDLIITDIIMPEKEGIETIIEFKQDFPEAKIIAISGGGRIGPEEYLNMAKSLGVLRTFYKPFERMELLEAVREILKS